jgi:hypothetical protein
VRVTVRVAIDRDPLTRAPRAARPPAHSLLANGVPLIVNVLAAGVGGFVFWIVTARSVEPAVVAEASAMVASMFGVAQLSLQHLMANVPPLIAASPRPRRLAGHAYLLGATLTAVTAVGYVVFGPRLASGLDFLRDRELAAVFVLGCLAWSCFSLQDAVLAGVRKGHIVLAENTAWSLARLAIVVLAPLAGLELGVAWIVGSWLLPAVLLVAAVSGYLFVGPRAALRDPLGDHAIDRRRLLRHMGLEQLTAIANGIATIVVPVVALSILGAGDAAPFLTAYSFILVCENALASFAGAFAVELRRSARSAGQLLRVTGTLLFGGSLVVIVGAVLFADDLMALFGPEYREPGGAVLTVLVLGLPARSLWLVAGAINRVNSAGLRNLVQQLAYSVVLVALLLLVDVQSGTAIAWCAVVARWSAAAVSAVDILALRRRDDPRRQTMVSVV